MNKRVIPFLCASYIAMCAVTISVRAGAIVRVSAEPVKGEVINAFSREPVPGAVVNASWVMEPVKGNSSIPERRLTVQQVSTDEKGQFESPGWSAGRRIPDGWRIKPGHDPKITVFSNGFYHGEFYSIQQVKGGKGAPVNNHKREILQTAWKENRQFLLRPFSDYSGQGMYAGPKWDTELSTRLDTVRTEIAAFEGQNKSRAWVSQSRLLALLKQNCEVIKEIEISPVCAQAELKPQRKNPTTSSQQNSYEPVRPSFYPDEEEAPVQQSVQMPGVSLQEISPR